MRTTVDIDDDVLQTAKDLARDANLSLGRILSELARKSLFKEASPSVVRNGVPLLSVQAKARPVTSQAVAELLAMDE